MNNNFTMDELNELEMVEVKGGVSSTPAGQNQCVNNSIGCGAGSVPQTACVNAIEGCSTVVTPPSVQTSTECATQYQCNNC